jgi:hypothetical protein
MQTTLDTIVTHTWPDGWHFPSSDLRFLGMFARVEFAIGEAVDEDLPC